MSESQLSQHIDMFMMQNPHLSERCNAMKKGLRKHPEYNRPLSNPRLAGEEIKIPDPSGGFWLVTLNRYGNPDWETLGHTSN